MSEAPPHAFVDHVLEAQLRIPSHLHADLDKGDDDAGVLTDRTLAHGAHARVHQHLGQGRLGGRRLFDLPGTAHGADEVHGVVVGDELQRVGDALDHVLLLDDCH